MKSCLLLVLLCSGCTLTSITSEQSGIKTTARSAAPAWPWQDSNVAINKMYAGAMTNKSYVSMQGVGVTETTSTNATGFFRGWDCWGG